MIIVSRQGSDPGRILRLAFESPTIDGHDTLIVNCQLGNCEASLERALKSKPATLSDVDKDIYILGFDHWEVDAELAHAVYNHFGGKKTIISVPTLENPDLVRYVYKQQKYPDIPFKSNSEPWITFSPKVARLYYHMICGVRDFDKSDLMIEEFGDIWDMDNSNYEKTRMYNIRDLIIKNKIWSILDIGSYLGQLADLLEINNVEVIRTDSSSAVLRKDSRVLDIRSMSASSLAAIMLKAQAVMFASVLFAYKEESPEIRDVLSAIRQIKPKYIIYEDSILNLTNNSKTWNAWVEYFSHMGYTATFGERTPMSIEALYENKCIKRHGSFTCLLTHYEDR